MKQVFAGGPNGVFIEEVPAPSVVAGQVLVRVAHSLISTGTEGAGIRGRQALDARTPVRRVLEDPRLIAKAARRVVTDGVGATVRAIRGEGDGVPSLEQLGYS